MALAADPTLLEDETPFQDHDGGGDAGPPYDDNIIELVLEHLPDPEEKYKPAAQAFAIAVKDSETEDEVHRALEDDEDFPQDKAEKLAISLVPEDSRRDHHYLPLFNITLPSMRPVIEKMFSRMKEPATVIFSHPLMEHCSAAFVGLCGCMKRRDSKDIVLCQELKDSTSAWEAWVNALKYLLFQSLPKEQPKYKEIFRASQEIMRAEGLDGAVNNPDDTRAWGILEKSRKIYDYVECLLIAMMTKVSLSNGWSTLPNGGIEKSANEVLQKLVENKFIQEAQGAKIKPSHIKEVERVTKFLTDMGANPLGPSTVAIVANSGPTFKGVAMMLGRRGLDVAKADPREFGNEITSILLELIKNNTAEYLVCFIVEHLHVVKEPLKESFKYEMLEYVVRSAAGKSYYDTMVELCKLDSSGRLQGTSCLALIDKDDANEVQEDLVTFLERVHMDLYASCHDSNDYIGNVVMDAAADQGLTTFIKFILGKGYTKLLYYEYKGKLPLETAVDNEKYDTAVFLLKRMKKTRALGLFKCGNQEKPRIPLYLQLEKLGKLSDQNQVDKCEKLQEFVLAVLDTCVYKSTVDCELLEADRNGGTDYSRMTVRQDHSGNKQHPDHHQTCYDLIGKYELTGIQKHICYQRLVDSKWSSYGWKLHMIPLVAYLLFMAFLTTSLVLAAKSSDPTDYSDSVDWFRLFCEIVTLFGVVVDVVLEVYDIRRTYRWRKRRSDLTGNIKQAIKVYATDWLNWVDWLAILFILLIIICRSVNDDCQWIFAALTFVFYGLRVSKYAFMNEDVGIYVQILIQIPRVLVGFTVVLILVAIFLGGGLYFSLRGELSGSMSNATFDPVSDTSLGEDPKSTSEIYRLWMTVVRTLVEGGVLDYYNEYKWFSIIIYWLVIFIVAVVMLNLLIAQFNSIYEEQTDEARHTVTILRSRALYQWEVTDWPGAKQLITFWRNLYYRKSRNIHQKTALNEIKDPVQQQLTSVRMKLLSVEEKIAAVSITVHNNKAALQDMGEKMDVIMKYIRSQQQKDGDGDTGVAPSAS